MTKTTNKINVTVETFTTNAYIGNDRLVAQGKAYGYNFMIISRDYCPCIYIDVTRTNIRGEEDCPIVVYGGITFYGLPSVNTAWDEVNRQRRWIGWDYGHYGDFNPKSTLITEHAKVWNVEELIKAAINGCYQLSIQCPQWSWNGLFQLESGLKEKFDTEKYQKFYIRKHEGKLALFDECGECFWITSPIRDVRKCPNGYIRIKTHNSVYQFVPVKPKMIEID